MRVRRERRGDNALFNVTQEPQIRDVSHARKDIDKLASTNERHPKESSASRDLGVIQVPSVALSPVQDRKEGGLPVDSRVNG
jgi:hypothetical protein